ncbi:MAG: hypothetical protein E7273_13090 [Pseudobutyrivibrio ruminis]|nr:hypothetical protein [Pseudobutyrivibrio ruminis]
MNKEGNVIKPPESIWVKVNHAVTKTNKDTDIIYLYANGCEGVERIGKSNSYYSVTKFNDACPGVARAL